MKSHESREKGAEESTVRGKVHSVRLREERRKVANVEHAMAQSTQVMGGGKKEERSVEALEED